MAANVLYKRSSGLYPLTFQKQDTYFNTKSGHRLLSDRYCFHTLLAVVFFNQPFFKFLNSLIKM